VIIPPNTYLPKFYWLTISEHGVMFILLWIDNIFNNIRFYKRHALVLGCIMALYLKCNVVVTFYFAPVYAIIDWKTRISFIFAGAAIALTILHFFLGIYVYNTFKKERV